MKKLFGIKKNYVQVVFIAGFLILLSFVSNTYAANYPLEITNIKPAGTGSPAIGVNNRIFRAYPGIEYNIRPAVIGGAYPYTFALSNEPSGMIINKNTGEISWPNPPTGTTGSITLSVTDSENTNITTSWSITVGTAGFLFVDASYTGTEMGTISQPYNSIQDFLDLTSEHVTDIIYFREGTYLVPIFHNSYCGDTNGCNLSWDNGKARIWIAYPEESVTIDMDDHYLETYADVQYQFYFDNLTFTNMTNWGIRSGSGAHYYTIRRCDFNNLQSSKTTNANQGFIFVTRGPVGYYRVFQDTKWHNYSGAAGLGSLYRMSKLLIEDCEFYDQFAGVGNIKTAIAIKTDIDHCTVRNNRVTVTEGSALGTGVNGCFNYCNNLEICFNLFKVADGDTAHVFNLDNNMGLTYFYRNTSIGYFKFQALADAGDGPYYFDKNVLINDNNRPSSQDLDHFYMGTNPIDNNPADFAEDVIQTNMLKGFPPYNIVDSNGKLQGTYRDQYLGTRGWETVSNEPTIEDKINPVISIESPPKNPASTTLSTITISGQASDNVGMQSVKWALNGNAPVNAIGLNNWSASIPLVEGENNIVFTATDTSGNPATASKQVNYTISEDTHTITFGETSDADYKGTVQDTFININQDKNPAAQALNTYTWQTNQPANAILMKWNLLALPAGAWIESAKLYLYMTEAGGDTEYDISVHNIINHNPDLTKCTGYTYDGTNYWSSNNKCFNSIPLAQADIADAEDQKPVNASSGYKTWNVTNMARAWLNDSNTNYGLLVNSDSSASADSYRTFASSEATNENQRPKLIVTYTIDPDTIPPRDITNARKESMFGSLLKLAWKNPAGLDGSGQTIPENQDFAGVMIRYNTGDSYPADHTEGILFGNKTGSLDQDDSFTETIDPVGDCKFSFFAYDADGNFSSTVHLTVDTTLPDKIGDFTAVPGDGKVVLGWTNPGENFAGVMIRCNTGSAPADYTEGSLVYQGTGSGFTHTQGVANDTTYYYSAFSYSAAGNYNTAVTVSATPTAASNTAPGASTSGSQTSGSANEAVHFTGSGADAGGSIVSYAWDFGDGTTSSEQNPSHVYTAPDTYNVTLTVTDNEGASGSSSFDVVIGADHTPPAIVSVVGVR